MRMLIACLLAGVAFVSGCATEVGESQARTGYDFGKLDKIAVLDVSGAASDAAKNQIGDFFVLELLKKGYAPVERTQVQTLLKEQQFQSSGLTSAEDAVKVGKILNVPAVMLVSIPDNEEEISLTAKIVSVEDGSILWQGTGYGKKNVLLSTIVGAAAGAGVGAVTGHAVGGREGGVVGGVAGGVLGGAAGNTLTPQQAEQIQKIVKEICKQLPSRAGPGR